MALKSFVKVGNITNLSDARYCAGMGVDQLGFNTDPDSESYVKQEDIESIREWISGVEIIAEGKEPEISELFDGIQLNLSQAQDIGSPLPRVITVTIDELRSYPELPDNTNYILLTGTDAIISKSDLDELSTYSGSSKILLGYGFTKDNVLELVAHPAISGIAMKGSEEIRPGYKDYNELMDILEVLEDDPWD